MGSLKQKIPATAPQAIASFNFTDIAEGTGIVVLNGFQQETSAATTYALSQQSPNSVTIETEWAETGETFTKQVDLDFDLGEFNLPQDIKGTALFNINVWSKADGGGDTITSYIHFRLRKWDGSAETEIANARSADFAETDNTGVNHTVNVPLTVTNTHFKKGEQLRITVEGYSKIGAAAQSGVVAIGHDPGDRDGTRIKPSTDPATTKFINHIPFRINV